MTESCPLGEIIEDLEAKLALALCKLKAARDENAEAKAEIEELQAYISGLIWGARRGNREREM